MVVVAPIVEGHGEVQAVPALLHRLAPGGPATVRVNPPIRVKAGAFLHDKDYFRRHVALAAAKVANVRGLVLILLDCDDDCPAELGPDLLQRALAVREDVHVVVALAYREYETWFIAAARSLRGRRGLPMNLEPPADPEAVRDAKGWLSARMDYPYDPVVHQVEFTRAFDPDLARANASFRRLAERLNAVFEADS